MSQTNGPGPSTYLELQLRIQLLCLLRTRTERSVSPKSVMAMGHLRAECTLRLAVESAGDAYLLSRGNGVLWQAGRQREKELLKHSRSVCKLLCCKHACTWEAYNRHRAQMISSSSVLPAGAKRKRRGEEPQESEFTLRRGGG